MDKNLEWFDEFKYNQNYFSVEKNPVAYFCAEFAISDDLPIYAGGLGVLAGDLVKEAYDRKFPMVAVGLYYYKGYQKNYENLIEAKNPDQTGLQPVLDKDGNPVKVYIPTDEGKIAIVAWRWDKGTIPIYLLDANLPENSEKDKKISQFLYAQEREIRLRQELVLGVGGVRLLEAIGIKPSIYHMNEGHSALLAFEIAKNIMQEKNVSFSEASEIAKNKIAFTNHTLVAAGTDLFNVDLFALILENYSKEIYVPLSDLMTRGIMKETDQISMTNIALRSASRINGVSIMHTAKANLIWNDHPLMAITNGIHVPTWNSLQDSGNVWDQHLVPKRELLDILNGQSGNDWKETDLLIGWARRMADYKQPLKLFENLEKLKRICQNSDRPVRFVFAGFPHFDDSDMGAVVNRIKELASGELKGNLIFLDGYSMTLSKKMISGCDVWLNTPIVGFEACGTSGMKAALNGVLPFSTIDGWMPEVNIDAIGWSLRSNDLNEEILDILEASIIPSYYEDFGNPDSLWVKKMQSARNTIKENFSATRMLKDYITRMYLL